MTSTIKGGLAGLAGTSAMVGVITTLRRGLLSSEQLAAAQTHPEKIVQRGADMAGAGRGENRLAPAEFHPGPVAAP
jgi:hypothetical protein